MKNQDKEVIALIGIGIVLGLIIGVAIGMLTLSNFYPTFQSDKWAAWLQAVGSIVAVIAAFIISGNQTRKESLKKSEENRSKIDGVYVLARQARATAYKKIKNIREEGDIVKKKEIAIIVIKNFESFYDFMSRVNRHEHPYLYIGIYLSNSRNAVSRLLAILSKFEELDCSLPPNIPYIRSLEYQMEIQFHSLDRATKKIKSIKNRYNGETDPNVGVKKN
ncbi:hypothetical protein OSH04_02130 [Alcaligenes sp. A-TC2]|uniref:hypothetical protein n=1 Tax=Alcaligenes nematophilus TaxID=2994643 RepID=UPI00225720DF|nr:hypothetical protein [Alcaligenes nematophilus]MCX5470507.1 hypothetical protein [Alcaligenes nematophilus]